MGRMFHVVMVSTMILGCGGQLKPLPPVQRPLAGYWFDTYRKVRIASNDHTLLAGAAKVQLTPTKRGVRIAGHGLYRKHSKGVLDDIYARVLYLDTGDEAVAFVSLDFIGFMHHRVDRIRSRVTRKYPHSIVIASTHNHDGPDTEGLWGEPVLGFLPFSCGVDRYYLDWVEKKVAKAILRAVYRAKPATLEVGRFKIPPGYVQNVREPKDVPLDALVLRAQARDGSTIGTIVNFGNHAEALQDKNRWLSSDWPGTLCRTVDEALGGVTLFFSAPAGGMLEPANSPDDPEPQRIEFMRRHGGVLAEGTIKTVLTSMTRVKNPRVKIFSTKILLPLDPGGTVALVIRLGLLEPRPMDNGSIITEAELVDLGQVKLLTIPGEISPEVGRMIKAKFNMKDFDAKNLLLLTLGLDHLGYMVSPRQYSDPRFDYERSMSLGPKTTTLVLQAVDTLLEMDHTRDN